MNVRIKTPTIMQIPPTMAAQPAPASGALLHHGSGRAGRWDSRHSQVQSASSSWQSSRFPRLPRTEISTPEHRTSIAGPLLIQPVDLADHAMQAGGMAPLGGLVAGLEGLRYLPLQLLLLMLQAFDSSLQRLRG